MSGVLKHTYVLIAELENVGLRGIVLERYQPGGACALSLGDELKSGSIGQTAVDQREEVLALIDGGLVLIDVDAGSDGIGYFSAVDVLPFV